MKLTPAEAAEIWTQWYLVYGPPEKSIGRLRRYRWGIAETPTVDEAARKRGCNGGTVKAENMRLLREKVAARFTVAQPVAADPEGSRKHAEKYFQDRLRGGLGR